jgi:phenylacetate-coenzyme A ligase PaaK-like adenylate-forming protein
MTEKTALEKLADYLLPKTLEHAVKNSEFYARHLGEGWRDVVRAEDLPKLPMLRKAECVEHQEEMRCGEAPADFGSVSSGTTRVGDRAFRVERCPAELEALSELHEMLDDIEGREPADPVEAPLVMHILTPNHGLPTYAAPANTLRFAWSPSRNVCDMIQQALEAEYDGKRITVLRCSVSILKQLTVFFLDGGVDFSRFDLGFIGTNAALVTRRWREVFERVWGARVFDNYSISEVKTPATECAECGWYHFAEPPVIAELVDPLTGDPVEEGVGELLLTALYPYVQRTPLIRYRTGDLVERGPRCPSSGADSLRFRGRRHQTLVTEEPDGSAAYLLFSSTLEDIADDHARVARHAHPFERAEKLPAQRVGQPKYRARLEEDEVIVELGTVFDPRLFPDEAASLTAAVRSALLKRHPALDPERLRVTLLNALRDDDWGEWFVKYLA